MMDMFTQSAIAKVQPFQLVKQVCGAPHGTSKLFSNPPNGKSSQQSKLRESRFFGRGLKNWHGYCLCGNGVTRGFDRI